MRLVLIFAILLFSDLNALSQEEATSKRIYSHLMIKDYHSASQEALSGLKQFPNSKAIWQASLKALAKSGDEKSLFSLWNQFTTKFPEENENRDLLETLCWAIIEKGSISSSPIVRIMSMIGAFFSQDSKGIAILQKRLQDENSGIRSIAIQLSSEYGDEPLKKEILNLLSTEVKWNVRLEAIKAIGKMKISEATPYLISLISQNQTPHEEKIAAISALAPLSKKMGRTELQNLIQGNRSGLKMLACELINYFEQIHDADLVYPLLKDNNAEVRAKALETIGLLRLNSPVVENLLNDLDPLVAISAAWVLTRNASEKGEEALKKFLKDPSQETRLLASAALAATGKYGYKLTTQQFNSHSDPYVRANLALGLINQRQLTEEASSCLYSALSKKEKWMWLEKGPFQALSPSKVKFDETIPNYPEAVNQLTRLEILNILAITHHPQSQQAIKKFLQEKFWGISSLASALLLTEGDEEAIDIVQNLLNDPDQNIKIQAALILALWGQGENALKILHESYPNVNRELKEKILEGIAKTNHPSSIPFLIQKLQDPSQTLRIITASALLACLYS